MPIINKAQAVENEKFVDSLPLNRNLNKKGTYQMEVKTEEVEFESGYKGVKVYFTQEGITFNKIEWGIPENKEFNINYEKIFFYEVPTLPTWLNRKGNESKTEADYIKSSYYVMRDFFTFIEVTGLMKADTEEEDVDFSTLNGAVVEFEVTETKTRSRKKLDGSYQSWEEPVIDWSKLKLLKEGNKNDEFNLDEDMPF